MNKFKDEPHVRDLKRCNAKTRNGGYCMNYPMRNGRCRLHGGKSTGPKTVEGLARSRKANYKHGRYSMLTKKRNKSFKDLLKMLQSNIDGLISD